MPIANCIVTSGCQHGSSKLIELWASESGQSSENMTINLITSTRQFGNRYSVMATLWLPSIWSTSEASSLQIGLAKALAEYFNLVPDEVHVITQLFDSGMVVEEEEMQW